ncbi:MAG: hypothetical protein AAB443_04745 [Patescibacteria group bacterium]
MSETEPTPTSLPQEPSPVDSFPLQVPPVVPPDVPVISNITKADLPPFSVLFEETLRIYKRNILSLTKVSLVNLMIYLAVTLIMGVAGGIIYASVAFKLSLLIVIPVSIILGVIALFFGTRLAVTTGMALIMCVSDVPFNGIKAMYKEAWGRASKYFFVSFVLALIVLGGFLLFVVPGVIWSLMFGLATYIVLFEDFGAIEALKESKRRTDGKKGKLVLRYVQFMVLMVLVRVVSAIPSAVFESTEIQIFGGILTFIIEVIVWPFNLIFPYLIYKYTKP